MKSPNKSQQPGKNLSKSTSRCVAIFLSLFLLSESTVAHIRGSGLQIAQQNVSTPSVPLNPEQQKRYQEGVKLYQEGQELEKKGTKEGYLQAIEKYKQALKIAQELGLQKEEVEILVYIGGAYSGLSEQEATFHYLQQALNKTQGLKPLYKASILGYIGLIYSNLGKLDDGINYLQESESIFLQQQKINRDELGLLARFYQSLAIAYNRKGEPEKAFDYLNKALKIYRDTLKSLNGEASVMEDMGFIYSQRGETSKALDQYNQALAIFERINNLPAQAQTLSYIASIHRKLGRYEQALNTLNKAQKLLDQVENYLFQQAMVVSNIADIYAISGDYNTAKKYYYKALELYDKSGDKSLSLLSLINISNMYKFSGEYQQALEYLNEGLKITVENKYGTSIIFQQKASIHSLQSDYQNALNEYNNALSIQRSIPSPKLEATTLKQIGLLYKSLGDYQSSVNYYTNALDIYKKIGDKPEQAIAYGLIARVYDASRSYDKALKSYEQALSLLNKEDYQSEILTLRGMVITYNSLKNYPKALEIAKRALFLSKDKGKGEEFKTLNIIADVYLTSGNYQKSLEIYQKILPYFQQLGLRFDEADILSNIGMTYTLSNQHQLAINTYNEELKLRRVFKNGTDEADTLYSIAKNQRKLGNLETALTNIDSAIKIVENIRSTVQNPDLRTSYFATVQNYYKFKINLLMELHKKDPSKGYNAQAIETSEASRARGLVELLTEARANIRKGANPELLAEDKRLQDLINAKEKIRFEIVNSEKIRNPIFKANADKLQTEIDELLNQQKQLETKIRQSNPKYANLKYPQPLKLAQIQQQLDQDTLLLQYSLGEERSFLWVVSPTSLDSYELPKKSEIDKSAINLFCLISDRSSKPPSATNQENPCANIQTRRIDQAATELSKLILEPVKAKLEKKRLVIVADGALQYIPFAALADLTHQPNSQPQTGKISSKNSQSREKDDPCSRGLVVCFDENSPNNKFDYQPLLINHEIVNLPSASAIAIQRQELANRSSTGKKALAILADPVYSAADANARLQNPRNKETKPSDSLGIELERSALKRSADILNRSVWNRLPGTRTEANEILKLVPKSNRLEAFDFDANYNWVTSSALNQFRILHFATHGFVNDVNPELSGIVLSLVDKQGKDIRGYLRLGDLFNLDYSADLIVLSACETGLGKEIQGEGLVGLTRGLMYAGGERLLLSLWKVDDRGTSEFMQEFYRQMLQEGKSVNEALRATQLKMWRSEKWRNPNYWAAFTLQGEWR